MALAAAGLASVPRTGFAQLITTPAQPAGPFYPLELPLDEDNDLTRFAGSNGSARGDVIHVVGRVLDASGAVIPAARVELWQANAEGRYPHPGDHSAAAVDPGFQVLARC